MQLKLFRGNVEKLMTVNSALECNLPIYIPRKLDNIDMALAEYVNNSHKKQTLHLAFIRESAGQYKFGTKRVSLSLQQNSN